MAKLHYYPLPNTSQLSDLLCRHCHNLTYPTTNCGGNRWYREVAGPLKKMLREREGLPWQSGARHQDRLEEIDAQIRALKEKLKPKSKRARPPGTGLAMRERRPYRNISLIE